MKKMLIVINLMIIAFAMSGCGCSKKNENLKTITCTYSDSDVSDTFTMYFEDDIAKSFDSKKVYVFATEDEANEVVAQFQEQNVSVEKNKIIFDLHHDYTDEEIIKYDEIIDLYPNYDCK